MTSIEVCPCSSAAGGGGDDDVGGSTAAAALGDSAKGKERVRENQSVKYVYSASDGGSCDVGSRWQWWHERERDSRFSRRCRNSRRE